MPSGKPKSSDAQAILPGFSVAEMLRTTRWELSQFVTGCGAIGDYLFDLYEEFVPDVPGRSKTIWAFAPVAFLLNPAWLRTHLTASPVLSDHLLYGQDPTRHPVRVASWINRDAVYTDLFATLCRATIDAISLRLTLSFSAMWDKISVTERYVSG